MKGQGIHDRVRRDWRHLDFFQIEAWLHADVPRVDCGACGKTTTVEAPWARPGSGFTLLFEARALTLCQSMPVAHAASLLRVNAKQLWRRIEHYVGVARAQEVPTNVHELMHDVDFRYLHEVSLSFKELREINHTEFGVHGLSLWDESI